MMQTAIKDIASFVKIAMRRLSDVSIEDNSY